MKINVDGIEISIKVFNDQDFVSLTDMAKSRSVDRSPDRMIGDWMKNRDTLEFLEAWEGLNNSDFKPPQTRGLYDEIGLNRFYMSPKRWIEGTDSVGIITKAGRGGGTFAHKDIAYHFGMWLQPKFALLVIREFDRLKTQEAERIASQWDFRRFLSKINYPLQTEAIKESMIPRLTKGDNLEKAIAYASEADLVNLSLFGCTAKQWREANPDLKGNMRDHANAIELTVLSNLQSLNAQLIRKGASKEGRFEALADTARFQLNVFSKDDRFLLDE